MSNPPRSAAVCHFERVRGRGDPEIARIASLQYGCVHRQQLLDAGLLKDAVLRRLTSGRLTRIHSDVFLVGSQDLPRGGAEMAAVLQLRGDAVLGASSAAAMWGLVDDLPNVVEVILVARNAKPRPGVRMHRVATLDTHDIRWRRGIPVTSPARTLVDLAATLRPLELENALAQARLHRLVNDGQLLAALKRARGRKGTGALRSLVNRTGPLAQTRSHYECRLLELIEAAQLPTPVTNVPVKGHIVDMLWPSMRLIVEFDGYAYHSDREAFERDRLRDQRLVASGYRVIRITARQLEQTPYAVVARLAQALG